MSRVTNGLTKNAKGSYESPEPQVGKQECGVQSNILKGLDH